MKRMSQGIVLFTLICLSVTTIASAQIKLTMGSWRTEDRIL